MFIVPKGYPLYALLPEWVVWSVWVGLLIGAIILNIIWKRGIK